MMDAAQAPQHMRALDRANQVRLARAGLKRRIADGTTSVGMVLEDMPPEAESMVIGDLLMSQHRWGSTRCRRFLGALQMSETKPLGTLTERQRTELIARLAGNPADERFVSFGDRHLALV